VLFVEILLIAVALSLDAMVACCITCACYTPQKGKSLSSQVITLSLSFGLFQAGMTIFGWSIGYLGTLNKIVLAFDHWIAFLILALVGGKMVYSGVTSPVSRNPLPCPSLSLSRLLALSVATSIDAAAVGVGLAFTPHSLLFSALVIGTTTFLLSLLSGAFGEKLAHHGSRWPELIGGSLLILIGVRIVLTHLFP
jgi:putative Mn2+ efflux pump MntP